MIYDNEYRKWKMIMKVNLMNMKKEETLMKINKMMSQNNVQYYD